MIAHLLNWLNTAPLSLIGVLLFVGMTIAFVAAYSARAWQMRAGGREMQKFESQEGYIVSAVLGLLALLMGFTFSLAIERFETRRQLVVADANAIGTAYLRAQLVGEPYRSHLSQLLIEFTDNKITLARANATEAAALLAKDDRLLAEIWSATAEALQSIKRFAYSTTLVAAMNDMIDLDASRRAARSAHVPTEIFALLLLYLIVTAGVFGYVLSSPLTRVGACLLMGLLTFSLLIIIDIDRPTTGGILESQGPMEALRLSLKAQPPPGGH